MFLHADGYTVSDVVMYWKETPVRGVEDAELPQFTILGHETNDRKVRNKHNKQNKTNERNKKKHYSVCLAQMKIIG